VDVNHSILSFFWSAGPVVKVVMLILLAASILSWTYIFERWIYLKKILRESAEFEQKFWSGIDLKSFYQSLTVNQQRTGLAEMFVAGFKEYINLRKHQEVRNEVIVLGMRRAMQNEQNKLNEQLELHLPFMATVGSISPYIGLFGTVWGIMTSFSALGAVQQATIAMVAPGISEALIATAMGLFAAIPAVIAYNRFTLRVDHLLNKFESFQEELTNIVHHQLSRTSES
jgi:biopolymer transport protein TolQ